MSTPQITLTDCLAEMNNALNYWYPLPVRDSKLDEELGSYRHYGASREECDARHVRLFQFRDRLQQQLRAAGKSAAFDLALAIAERDKAQIECCEASDRADSAEISAAQLGDELEKLRIVHRDAVDGWNKAALERDNARQSLRAAEQDCDDMQSINSDLRTVNARLIAERDAAMERLNHAESIIMQ